MGIEASNSAGNPLLAYNNGINTGTLPAIAFALAADRQIQQIQQEDSVDPQSKRENTIVTFFFQTPMTFSIRKGQETRHDYVEHSRGCHCAELQAYISYTASETHWDHRVNCYCYIYVELP